MCCVSGLDHLHEHENTMKIKRCEAVNKHTQVCIFEFKKADLIDFRGTRLALI